MSTFYLRMEGVNLSSFVYDCQDLSTVRGGGLMLLVAVERYANALDLQAVTTGASNGIFAFHADDATAAQAKRDALLDRLRDDIQLRHATFVIDVVGPVEETCEDFVRERERLLAMNRWRQWQRPTVAIPGHGKGPCAVDLVRPATGEIRIKKEKKWVSESVRQRRDYGINQKQSFYGREAPEIRFVHPFTYDLDQLAHDRAKGNLNHKMAVIYLDGNRFGGVQTDRCPTPEKQAQFDDTIKRYRKTALTSLMKEVISDSDYLFEGEDAQGKPLTAYRFETLLWGGDEIIWVVPAWKGWEVVDLFFQLSRDWAFDGEQLTHACGLVFCHHNAPIHRITRLAHDLAEIAKKKSRDANLVAYEILESFDFLGRDLTAHRAERCTPADLSPDDLLLPASHMAGIHKAMATLKEELPRRQLAALAYALHQPGSLKEAQTREKEVTASLSPQGQAALEEAAPCFGKGLARWIHLYALWDYFEGGQ